MITRRQFLKAAGLTGMAVVLPVGFTQWAETPQGWVDGNGNVVGDSLAVVEWIKHPGGPFTTTNGDVTFVQPPEVDIPDVTFHALTGTWSEYGVNERGVPVAMR